MGSYLDALFAGLQTVAARGPRTTEGSGRGERTEDRGQRTTGGQLYQASYDTNKHMKLVTNFTTRGFMGDE